jgi:hypothetical protein
MLKGILFLVAAKRERICAVSINEAAEALKSRTPAKNAAEKLNNALGAHK